MLGVVPYHLCRDRLRVDSLKNRLPIPLTPKNCWPFILECSPFGKTLQVHMDNCTTLASISKKGSSNIIRDKITRHIFEHMSQLGATLQAVFVEGRSNLVADGLSRRVKQNRFTDWSIDDDTWKLICKHFRFKPNLDAFATVHNARLDCYCSWVRDLRSTYVDAFSLNWNQFKIYAFPPPSVIGRCLQKIQEDVALEVGMIVLFMAKTSYWFTTMVNLLCAMPVLLPKVTVCKLHLPWDPSATHPLANNLCLLFVHLSAKSCESTDVSLNRFQKQLQNFRGKGGHIRDWMALLKMAHLLFRTSRRSA